MPDEVPADGGESRRAAGSAEGVVDRLVELFTTTLDVGASLARTVAASTTTREVPQRGDTPLDDIVTFGAAAAGNIARRAVDTVRSVERLAEKMRTPPPGEWKTSAPESTVSGRPRLTRGSVLRLPLLVENTGPTPTTELSFGASEVIRVAGADGEGISVDQVTFTPPTLVIGQRDFEKLTVRIHTTESTAPGVYQATVTGGEGWFNTAIEFEVVESSP
jgi:hypothetical protein